MIDEHDGKVGTATSILVHYFKSVFESNGLYWSPTNEAEMQQLVEAIVKASKSS